MTKKKQAATVSLEVPCPCGGTAALGGLGKGEKPFALHSLPPCKKFAVLDVLSYVRWLNSLNN